MVALLRLGGLDVRRQRPDAEATDEWQQCQDFGGREMVQGRRGREYGSHQRKALVTRTGRRRPKSEDDELNCRADAPSNTNCIYS